MLNVIMAVVILQESGKPFHIAVVRVLTFLDKHQV